MAIANVLRMKPFADLDDRLVGLFGAPTDPMPALEARARELFPGEPVIVWQCDLTLRFSYVGGVAETLLGYPVRRWLEDPGFWADRVIHPLDRDDAKTYCALATEKGADHEFEYRATAQDGRTLWLRDVVRVVRDAGGRITTLRGAIFDVTGEKARLGLSTSPPQDFEPPRRDLLAKAG